MGGLVVALLAATTPAQRHDQFLHLLRTYPERKPEDTFAQVQKLVDEGEFEERDRAEYWIGSARLAAGDRDGARQWFSRLARDYPDGAWAQRSLLGLGDAAVQERSYGAALDFYARAAQARDPAVRELSRISATQTRILRARQRGAIAAGLVALAIAVLFVLRAKPLWPPPPEIRIVWPVLAILALLTTRIDRAPRIAVLEFLAAGAVLIWLSGARLRATPIVNRLAHAALGVVALGCVGYVAVYRGDLVGMVLETLRAGPE